MTPSKFIGKVGSKIVDDVKNLPSNTRKLMSSTGFIARKAMNKLAEPIEDYEDKKVERNKKKFMKTISE